MTLPVHSPRASPARARGPLARLVETLAQLVGGRIFHGGGACYHATLAITSGWEGVPALAPGVEHRAIVRVSRATGLPGPLPDSHGIALRLPNLYGVGRHQDFLLVTSSRGPLLQHLALPGVHAGQPYSSLIPYSIGDDVRVLGVLPDGARHYKLAVAPISGGWTPIGELSLGERLPSEVCAQLSFSLYNSGEGLTPLAVATAR